MTASGAAAAADPVDSGASQTPCRQNRHHLAKNGQEVDPRVQICETVIAHRLTFARVAGQARLAPRQYREPARSVGTPRPARPRGATLGRPPPGWQMG